MRLALIDKLIANAAGDDTSPSTDPKVHIQLEPEEQSSSVAYSANWVQSAVMDGKGTLTGWFRDSTTQAEDEAAAWEMTLTPTRLLLWSPMTMGIFGKMKAKTGAATGGQFRYEWIEGILAGGSSGRPGRLKLSLFSAPRNSSSISAHIVVVEFRSPEEAAIACTELTNRVEAYWASRGVDVGNLHRELDKLRDFDWRAEDDFSAYLDEFGIPVELIP